MSRIKKHYYWLVIGILVLHLMIHGGIINSVPLFLLPAAETFGVSRSAVALPGSLKGLASFICSFFTGTILLRFGYRKSMTFFIAVTVVGLFILSQSTNMVLYYIGSLLFGVTESFCISISAPRIVSSWFHRYRGTILGLVMCSTGLGGSVMCVLLSNVVEKSGWQQAYLIGGLLLAIPLLLIPVFIRNRPEEMGLTPFGEGERIEKKKEVSNIWAGFTYRQVLRSPLFYLLMLGTLLSSLFAYGVYLNLIPFLQDHGFTVQQSASIQSVLLFALAASKLGAGFLSDAIGVKKVVIISLIAAVISPILFTTVLNPTTAVIGALLCAISLPLVSVLVPLLSAKLFGYQAQTSFLGLLVAMVSLAGMLSTPIANLVFDRIGSYAPFFRFCAVGAACLIFVYLILYKLADREKERLLQSDSPN